MIKYCFVCGLLMWIIGPEEEPICSLCEYEMEREEEVKE